MSETETRDAGDDGAVLRSIAKSIQPMYPDASDMLLGIERMHWPTEAHRQHEAASAARAELARLRAVVEAVQALHHEVLVPWGAAHTIGKPTEYTFTKACSCTRNPERWCQTLAALAPVSSSGEAESEEAPKVVLSVSDDEGGYPCPKDGTALRLIPSPRGAWCPECHTVWREVGQVQVPAPVLSGDQVDGESVRVEAAARALASLEPDEPWPSNADLGGSPTGTRDDEYRDGLREQAREVLAAVDDLAARPVPSGGQADGEGDLWSIADEIIDRANIEDVNPPSVSEAIADVLRENHVTAARPVLSREALARLLGEHAPVYDYRDGRFTMECEACDFKMGGVDREDMKRRFGEHFAGLVLAGGEQA